MNFGASSNCDGLSSSGRVLSLLMSRDSALICMTQEQGFGVVGVNGTLTVVLGMLIGWEVEALWYGRYLLETQDISRNC